MDLFNGLERLLFSISDRVPNTFPRQEESLLQHVPVTDIPCWGVQFRGGFGF